MSTQYTRDFLKDQDKNIFLFKNGIDFFYNSLWFKIASYYYDYNERNRMMEQNHFPNTLKIITNTDEYYILVPSLILSN